MKCISIYQADKHILSISENKHIYPLVKKGILDQNIFSL